MFFSLLPVVVRLFWMLLVFWGVLDVFRVLLRCSGCFRVLHGGH